MSVAENDNNFAENDDNEKETEEVGLTEALVNETEALKALIEASDEVPVFTPWELFTAMFPALTGFSEYGARLGWFSLAKAQYGFLTKMAESSNFQPEVAPQMEVIIDEIKKVFPGVKDLKNLNSFFTMGDSEVAMIGLAKELGVPGLLTSDTAPYLFSQVPPEIRSKILDVIDKRGNAGNELKAAIGFTVPSSNGQDSDD